MSSNQFQPMKSGQQGKLPEPSQLFCDLSRGHTLLVGIAWVTRQYGYRGVTGFRERVRRGRKREGTRKEGLGVVEDTVNRWEAINFGLECPIAPHFVQCKFTSYTHPFFIHTYIQIYIYIYTHIQYVDILTASILNPSFPFFLFPSIR